MARNPAERRRPTWLTILLFGLLAVGGVAAAAIIVMLPVIVLTIMIQKEIVQGLSAGGVK